MLSLPSWILLPGCKQMEQPLLPLNWQKHRDGAFATRSARWPCNRTLCTEMLTSPMLTWTSWSCSNSLTNLSWNTFRCGFFGVQDREQTMIIWKITPQFGWKFHKKALNRPEVHWPGLYNWSSIYKLELHVSDTLHHNKMSKYMPWP